MTKQWWEKECSGDAGEKKKQVPRLARVSLALNPRSLGMTELFM
jgi:hypothetical protein